MTDSAIVTNTIIIVITIIMVSAVFRQAQAFSIIKCSILH